MARSLFAGRPGDTVVSLFSLGTRQVVTLPVDANGDPTSATLEVWDAPDGVRLTDLLEADGTTATDHVVAPQTGQIPEFFGPDGVNVSVYIRDPDGDFFRLDARFDDAAEVAAAAVADAEAAAAAAAAAAASVNRGGPNGVAPLDGTSKVPQGNLPAHLTPTALNASVDARRLSNTFPLRALSGVLAIREKGNARSIRYFITGTSTADLKRKEYGSDIERIAGGFAGAINIAGGSNTGSPRSVSGLSNTITGTVTATASNDTAVWHGKTQTLSAGSSIAYGSGGVDFTFDNAVVLYFGASGASFSVSVGGGAPQVCDCSTIPNGQLGIFVVTVPSRAKQSFVVSQVSGTPKLTDVGAGLWDSTLSGVIWAGMTAPGLNWYTLASQAWTNVGIYLNFVNADLMTWEAKATQWTNDGVDASQLQHYLDLIKANSPTTDVLLIGGSPDSGAATPGGAGYADQPAANRLADATARTYAAGGLNVASWDGYAPLGSWANITALDARQVAMGGTAGWWQADGIHLGWMTQRYLSQLMLRDIGIWDLFRNYKASSNMVTQHIVLGSPLAPVLDLSQNSLDVIAALGRAIRYRLAGSSTDWMVFNPLNVGQSFLPSDMRVGAANGPKIASVDTTAAYTTSGGAVTADLGSPTATTVTLTLTLGANMATFGAFQNPGSATRVRVHVLNPSGYTMACGAGAVQLRDGFTVGGAGKRTTFALDATGGGAWRQFGAEAIVTA